jgi:hypothetical protein
MKREGLTGPLILIGLGTFFLLRRWVDIPPLWDLVREWWPLILIAIGIAQLLERMTPRGRE